MDPTAKNTENMSRDHIVLEDCPGLVTITGGKWTTYRRYKGFVCINNVVSKMLME